MKNDGSKENFKNQISIEEFRLSNNVNTSSRASWQATMEN